MNHRDVMEAGGDVLDLAGPGSSLPDHAAAVVGDRIAEAAPRADTPAALAEATAMLRSMAR